MAHVQLWNRGRRRMRLGSSCALTARCDSLAVPTHASSVRLTPCNADAPHRSAPIIPFIIYLFNPLSLRRRRAAQWGAAGRRRLVVVLLAVARADGCVGVQLEGYVHTARHGAATGACHTQTHTRAWHARRGRLLLPAGSPVGSSSRETGHGSEAPLVATAVCLRPRYLAASCPGTVWSYGAARQRLRRGRQLAASLCLMAAAQAMSSTAGTAVGAPLVGLFAMQASAQRLRPPSYDIAS
jgi:hypothetical protein